MVYYRLINESKHTLGASLNIKSKARELRKEMTVAERTLWKRLKCKQQKGKYFRRQHPYGIYILDFYCFEAGLAIELDGKIHMERKEYDTERTEFLESSGLKVLRFRNEDVERKLEWVITVINDNL